MSDQAQRHTEKFLLFQLLLCSEGLLDMGIIIYGLMAAMEPADVELVLKRFADHKRESVSF